MTRETKIGLLVGLAFILVIGILLSEHVTRSTEPSPAPLTQAGASVRAGAVAPGASANPPVTPVSIQPGDVQLRQAVPTQQELNPPVRAVNQGAQAQGPGSAYVQILPPDEGRGTPQDNRVAPPVTPVVIVPPAAQNNEPVNSGNAGNLDPRDPRQQQLAQLAGQHGEELVPVGPGGRTPGNLTNNNATPPAPTGTKSYTAQPGDSLSRLAAKLPGGNTKTNREAIVRLNPSLQQNPDMVVVGKSYQLPNTANVGDATASNGTTPRTNPPTPPSNNTNTPAPRNAAQPQYVMYTVKSGDSLWRIAEQQVGTPTAMDQIRELNRDVLRGDTVQVGMKLRLPKAEAPARTASAE
jgi:nucleoid-associated protein YgaU